MRKLRNPRTNEEIAACWLVSQLMMIQRPDAGRIRLAARDTKWTMPEARAERIAELAHGMVFDLRRRAVRRLVRAGVNPLPML